MFKTTSRYLAVAAASFALTLGAAHAADTAPTAAPTTQAHAGWHHGGWHHHHHGDFLQELVRLHKQLNLNADQEKQWQAALATTKQAREEARSHHKELAQQFKTALQQPILDLNALHAAQQQAMQQDAQLREQTTGAWLGVYNGLNDQQKTIVSTAIKQRAAKMEARHEKMRERWQAHRHAAPAPTPAASE